MRRRLIGVSVETVEVQVINSRIQSRVDQLRDRLQSAGKVRDGILDVRLVASDGFLNLLARFQRRRRSLMKERNEIIVAWARNLGGFGDRLSDSGIAAVFEFEGF